MTRLIEFVENEVKSYYVSPKWVADHYGVTRLQVHRAIRRGQLRAVVIALVGARDIVLLDRRLLPKSFPRR